MDHTSLPTSRWAAGVVLTRKKNSVKKRFCVDYRGLNRLTIKNQTALPRIDDLLDIFHGARVFSTIDLFSGYWQVPMDPEDVQKTAFTTKFGNYEFLVMPFGLKNAPATFQTLMNTLFHDFINRFMVVYLDDINIYSKTVEEHLLHLTMVLEKLKQAKLKINPDKSVFLKEEIKYLGFVISAEGLKGDPEHERKAMEVKRPQTVKQVRSFLGWCSFYRRFVQNFSKIAQPLYELTHSASSICVWSPNHQESFEILKRKMSTPPILQFPDFNKSFTLSTDASGMSIGAVLAQDQGKGILPVAYYSKKFTKQQQRYSTTHQSVWRYT